MKFAVAVLSVVIVVACSSPSTPTKAEPTGSQQQIIDRYIRDIWPATRAYNADHAQGGHAAERFASVTEPNLSVDRFNALRTAAESLGRQSEYDAQDQTSHYNDGLTLGHVEVQSAQDVTAALNVCYAYTDYWYVDAAQTRHAAEASELTVQLANVDHTWYLRGIGDGHVVASCGTADS